jgi:predicted secreted protein
MLKNLLVRFAIITLQPWLTVMVWAANDETLSYDRIHLSSTANTEVENDVLIAILYVQREGSKLPPLVNDVNEHIAKAVKQSRQIPHIDVQTLSHQTDPIYDKQRLSGWRVRQSILLKSQDSESLGQLIGDLQPILAVESIQYTVSLNKMREVEDKLIAEAIDAFSQRAKLVTNQFGYSRYRLVDINIDTATAIHSMRTRGAVMAMEVIAPPTIEAGKQEIQVTVNGTIEIQMK